MKRELVNGQQVEGLLDGEYASGLQSHYYNLGTGVLLTVEGCKYGWRTGVSKSIFYRRKG